jgi:hypothetical protein
MLKSIIAKAIAATAAAAIIASASVFLTSVAPEANAAPSAGGSILHPSVKGNRLPAPFTGRDCSLHGWPHYEPSCHFDLRKPASEPQTIRIIALR